MNLKIEVLEQVRRIFIRQLAQDGFLNTDYEMTRAIKDVSIFILHIRDKHQSVGPIKEALQNAFGNKIHLSNVKLDRLDIDAKVLYDEIEKSPPPVKEEPPPVEKKVETKEESDDSTSFGNPLPDLLGTKT